VTRARTVRLGDERLRLHATAATNIGVVRRANEDSLFADYPVFFVADGMGGHANGERASRRIVEEFDASTGSGSPTTTPAVLATIAAANTGVRALSARSARARAVAGSTLSGFALVDDHGDPEWLIFNVGDSRVYLWQDETLRQVTVDHSAVQELVDAGEISSLQAEFHPDRNVVTRAIGVRADVKIDVRRVPLVGRQVLIACTDGLTRELSDDRIADILRSVDAGTTFAPAARRLVAAAVDAGGKDNVTVVALEATRIGARD
jgi:protein phosphatase